MKGNWKKNAINHPTGQTALNEMSSYDMTPVSSQVKIIYARNLSRSFIQDSVTSDTSVQSHRLNERCKNKGTFIKPTQDDASGCRNKTGTIVRKQKQSIESKEKQQVRIADEFPLRKVNQPNIKQRSSRSKMKLIYNILSFLCFNLFFFVPCNGYNYYLLRV